MTQHPLSRGRARLQVLAAMVLPVAAWAGPTALQHYTIDPAKSSLEFDFVQAGAQNKGKFTRFPVTLDFSADNLAASKLEVTVQITSLDTGDKDRDETLRSPDLFDAAKFPQARFTSTQISKSASGYLAVGKLTIRGVTRDTQVPLTFRTTSEQGQPVGYLTGSTSIRRLDFGVGQGDWKNTGSDGIANDVKVSYSLRLTATPAP
jgi:polyisoprenoid-binding protein YceI